MSGTEGPWVASWNEDRTWVGVNCGSVDHPNCAEVCTVCLENIEEDNSEAARQKALKDARRIAAVPAYELVWSLVPDDIKGRIFDVFHTRGTSWVEESIRLAESAD